MTRQEMIDEAVRRATPDAMEYAPGLERREFLRHVAGPPEGRWAGILRMYVSRHFRIIEQEQATRDERAQRV